MTEKDFTNETLGNVVKEIDSLSEPTETFVTGLSTDMDEKYSELEAEVTSTINKNLNDTFTPRNRAERRALEKATRRQKAKQKRMYVDNIKEAAQKLAYINMIEKVRELNKQIEEEGEIENEAANEGNSNV